MKISKKDLQKALEIVKPGLANKEVIEQSTSFAFIDGRVVTYNDELSISHPVPGLNITCAIEAKNLYKFINKLKQDEISIEIAGDKKEVVVSSGKAQAGFALFMEVKLPLEELQLDKGKWAALPDNFSKALAFAVSASGKANFQPLLQCVHINETGFMEASDNFRIARFQLGKALPIKTCLIPNTVIPHIISLQPVKVKETKGWVHFMTSEDTIASCRTFNEKFPNCDPFFKVDGKSLELPKITEEVFDRAESVVGDSNTWSNSVDITIENNRMNISAENETRWFKEEINMKYKGEPISFSITTYLLRDILSKQRVCTVSPNKLLFQDTDWKYISTLRVKS